MRTKKFQALYLNYLREMGIKGVAQENGDIWFKYNGEANSIKMMVVEETDFFGIQFSYSWDLKPDEDIGQCHKVMKFVNYVFKNEPNVQIEESQRQMSANIGLNYSDPEDFKEFFPIMMNNLINTVHKFCKLMEYPDSVKTNIRPPKSIDVILDGKLMASITLEFLKADQGKEYGILAIPYALLEHCSKPKKRKSWTHACTRMYGISGRVLTCIEKQYFDNNVYTIPVEGYAGRGIDMERILEKKLPPQILQQMLSGTFKVKESADPEIYKNLPVKV